jgi:PEGA domain
MKRPWLRILLAIFALSTMPGCATIFSGSKQDVSFTSNPPGARVSVNEQYLGTTPFTARIRPGYNSRYVKFEKDGFEPAFFRMPKRLNPILYINLGVGGVGVAGMIATLPAAVGGLLTGTGNGLVLFFISSALASFGLIYSPLTDLSSGAAVRFRDSECHAVLQPIRGSDIVSPIPLSNP